MRKKRLHFSFFMLTPTRVCLPCCSVRRGDGGRRLSSFGAEQPIDCRHARRCPGRNPGAHIRSAFARRPADPLERGFAFSGGLFSSWRRPSPSRWKHKHCFERPSVRSFLWWPVRYAMGSRSPRLLPSRSCIPIASSFSPANFCCCFLALAEPKMVSFRSASIGRPIQVQRSCAPSRRALCTTLRRTTRC